MNHDEPVSDRELTVLREFVDALDRRVAHIEWAGEARIAGEAAAALATGVLAAPGTAVGTPARGAVRVDAADPGNCVF
jgi:hypothetical protein